MTDKRLIKCRDVHQLREFAYRIRRNVLVQAAGLGKGYVGQGLDAAEIFAVAYGSILDWNPDDLTWDARDRLFLSVGHYAIGIHAALSDYGIYSEQDLKTYCDDESIVNMSADGSSPGFEICGGPLGHGLSLALGAALGARSQNKTYRILNVMSDGELSEGSTWEAAMCAANFATENLITVVDINNIVADGFASDVLNAEPLVDKWHAFGWHVQRVNGNDVQALLDAFDATEQVHNAPHVILCDTVMGKGVDFIEERKAHFVRVEQHEWDLAFEQLEESENRRI